MDTLGRWMCHHIAGLIADADKAPDRKSKLERQAQAADAILRLWVHRSSLENRINPLFDLKPVVQAIRTLDPANNVWLHREDGARYAYDIFRRLVICLLLRKMSSLAVAAQAATKAKKTAKFQEESEREIISAIHLWISEAQKNELGEARSKRTSSKTEEAGSQDLDEIAQTLVDEGRKALDAVAAELARDRSLPRQKKSKGADKK